MSITVTIGICTYRRAHIALTLASIAGIDLPLDHAIRIIVADNDTEPSAQVTVADIAARLNLDVTYIHAPAHNISIARNAILEAASGDYLAFVDDDEQVTTHWLAALLARTLETNAPIVLGPVIAVYPENAPRWLRRSDFHSTYPTEQDGTITTGYCGNVLIRRDILKDFRFTPELGTTGGEDTDFFARLHNTGHTIAYAPEAVVYEGVPANRANLDWLIRRRYRFGQTHAATLKAQRKPRLWNMLLALGKMLTSFAMMALCALSPFGRRRWLLRGTFHLAVLRTLNRGA